MRVTTTQKDPIMDLDPAVTLGFTLRANPGAYVLLVGSGVSGDVVPNGWDVFVDLVTTFAAGHGYTGDDPIAWYRERRDGPVGYETILSDLTTTSEERVGLLRPYFEAGETAPFQPTPAHRAIARLVAAGLIRVVVTTNLDRLLERALEEAAVAPTVLASPDAIAGMAPLHQQRACVVKLHGDYLDPKFLNTGEELAHYPEEIDRLLDRIFDEYGLVIAGWSSASDAALRAAIERCTARRYGSYWIEPYTMKELALRLKDHRGAVVATETADSFFGRLVDTLDALERTDADHPATVPLAVATAKRHLERHDLIRLHDLVAAELTSARERVGTWPRNLGPGEALAAIVDRIDAVTRTATALVATSAYWGDEATDVYWQGALATWARQPVEGGVSNALDLRFYPATRLLYGAGVAMIAADRLLPLESLLRQRVSGEHPLSSELLAGRSLSCLEKRSRRDEGSDHVFEQLSPLFREELLFREDEFEEVYERFEYLLYLVSTDAALPEDPRSLYRSIGRICPIGSLFDPRMRPEVELEPAATGGVHPWTQIGLFGGDPDRLSAARDDFAGHVDALRSSGFFGFGGI